MTTIGNLAPVVSAEAWLDAGRELLSAEKDLTHRRDRVNAQRRRLPMVRIEKSYVFEGPEGRVGLGDLFAGRPQLVMHHFMFAPEWDEMCPSCASAADQIGHPRPPATSTTTSTPPPMTALHRCCCTSARRPSSPLPGLLGRPAPWTHDMRGEEQPGISAFLRVGDDVFHTYSTYGRGIEEFHNGYPWLDLTALGRQEAWEEPAGRVEPLGLQVGGPAMRLLNDEDR